MGARDPHSDQPQRYARVVVLIEWKPPSWALPPFRRDDRRMWIHGGERTMLEIGAAAAASGFEVELRGDFLESEVAGIERAARVSFRRPSQERASTERDIVLMPEGHPEPFRYARAALSGARVVVVMLAAPGLFGWSFDRPGLPEDLMRVDPATVGRPEQLAAARALGFELWTNARAIAEQARAHGVPLHYIGVGRPSHYPEPSPKHVDVVTVTDNRWAALARTAIGGLRPNISTVALPTLARDHLLAALGSGRILVHPARIEGRSRLCEEARAMRTVPVMLASNHIGEGLQTSCGGVAVDRLSQIAPAVHALLDDPVRLSELADNGYREARGVGAWEPFIERVAAALAAPDLEVARFATSRAVLGGELSAREDALRARFESIARELHAAAAERDTAVAELDTAVVERDGLHGKLTIANAELTVAFARYAALRRRKAVRVALRLASVRERFRALRPR